MLTILGIVILITIAFAGARLSFSNIPFVGDVYLFFLTGTEFIIVGLVLGPEILNLNADVLNGMDPFIGLGLGWLGILYGIQFDAKKLRRFPPG